MTTLAPAYPPPLSDAPTVGTLRDLLDALQAGTYEVPPVPPLPVPLTPVRAAMQEVTTTRWRVEHATSGVPVHLAVGDHLGVPQLVRLRDELGLVGAPTPPTPQAPPPSATWSARAEGRRDLHATLLALLVTVAFVAGVVGVAALA